MQFKNKREHSVNMRHIVESYMVLKISSRNLQLPLDVFMIRTLFITFYSQWTHGRLIEYCASCTYPFQSLYIYLILSKPVVLQLTTYQEHPPPTNIQYSSYLDCTEKG